MSQLLEELESAPRSVIGYLAWIFYYRLWTHTKYTRVEWKDARRELQARPEYACAVSTEPILNPLQGAPLPYELEFHMPGAVEDCQDWLSSNPGYKESTT